MIRGDCGDRSLTRFVNPTCALETWLSFKYYRLHLVPKFGDMCDRKNWQLHPTGPEQVKQPVGQVDWGKAIFCIQKPCRQNLKPRNIFFTFFAWSLKAIGGLPMCVLSYIFAWHRGSSGQRPWVRLLHSLVHCHLARLCEDLFSSDTRPWTV